MFLESITEHSVQLLSATRTLTLLSETVHFHAPLFITGLIAAALQTCPQPRRAVPFSCARGPASSFLVLSLIPISACVSPAVARVILPSSHVFLRRVNTVTCQTRVSPVRGRGAAASMERRSPSRFHFRSPRSRAGLCVAAPPTAPSSRGLSGPAACEQPSVAREMALGRYWSVSIALSLPICYSSTRLASKLQRALDNCNAQGERSVAIAKRQSRIDRKKRVERSRDELDTINSIIKLFYLKLSTNGTSIVVCCDSLK